MEAACNTLAFQKYRNYDFGEQEMKEVHISQRHARRQDGYYPATAKIDIY